MIVCGNSKRLLPAVMGSVMLSVWGILLAEPASGLDRDEDGMSDVWQVTYGIPTGVTSQDSDADGENNLRESLVGTDPNDASSNSRLSMRIEAPGDVRLSWFGVDLKAYHVLSRPGMGMEPESVLVGPVLGRGGALEASFVSTGAVHHVFRVKQVADMDRDGDGLLDWEERLFGSDPSRGDADGDGFVDAQEFLRGGDPFVVDPTYVTIDAPVSGAVIGTQD